MRTVKFSPSEGNVGGNEGASPSTMKLRLTLSIAWLMLVQSTLCLADLDAGLAALASGDVAKAIAELTPEAEAGNTIAQFNLGRIYTEDKLVAKDEAKALYWYILAAQAGHAESQYAVGYMQFNGLGVAQPLREEAVRWYRMAAEQGNAAAQFSLGTLYANGQGVEQDDAEAAKWFEKAAEQGHTEAQRRLALACFEGKGVVQDPSAGAHWLREVAGQGDVEAQMELGRLYDEGIGVARDDQQSLHWYKAAADQGNPDALFAVGLAYANAKGVERDPREAIRWYRQAAEKGHAGALFGMRMLYESGQVTLENDEEAVAFYKLGAISGMAPAQFDLARAYQSGTGVEQDTDQAVKWYEVAATQGHLESQLELARRYAEGDGMERNPPLAVKWYQRAAEQGSVDAQRWLGYAYANGTGLPVDPVEAIRWYAMAAEQGDTIAQYNMGFAYANGVGAPQDDAEAVRWYRRAAEQGNVDAQSNLAFMYFNGRGVPQDYIQAHVWANLAASNGDEVAQKNRDALAGLMTAGQLALAQEMARQWESSHAGASQAEPVTETGTQVDPGDTAAMTVVETELPTPDAAAEESFFGDPINMGTGFAVGSDGQVLTANHIVAGCPRVAVRLGERRFSAQLIQFDAQSDLAALSSNAEPLTPLLFSDNQSLRLGDVVHAAVFSYPAPSNGQFEISSGRIRGTVGAGRDERMYQTTAPIHAGEDGGPLVDQSGNLVGVAFSELSPLYTETPPEGISYVLKGTAAQAFLQNAGVPVPSTGSFERLNISSVRERVRQALAVVECWQ